MKLQHNTIATLAGVLLAGLMMTSADALGPGQKGDGCDDPGCCARCGCDPGCYNKVCRLVKVERELKATCWSSECEPVCLPCCSKRGCRHTECACNGDKDGKGGCCGPFDKKFVWFDYCPGSAKMRCKKRLMKKTVTKKVPGYKWVVENLCKGCEGKAKAEAPVIEPDSEVPPPPAVEARIIHGKPVHVVASFTREDTTRVHD